MIARKIDRIIIHRSSSLFGDASLIDKWHRERGFDEIGYHFVILNGYTTGTSLKIKQPQFWLDGQVQRGRDIEKIGAHAKGFNTGSIGICLIGERQFTRHQFGRLFLLIRNLMADYPNAQIVGHGELMDADCPHIDMGWMREMITTNFPDATVATSPLPESK